MEKVLGAETGTPCAICKGPTVWRRSKYPGKPMWKGCAKFPACRGKGKSDPVLPATLESEVIEDAVIVLDPPESEEEEMARSKKQEAPSAGSLEALLWAAFGPQIEARVKEAVSEAINGVDLTVTHSWTVNEIQLAEFEGRPHKALNEILRRVKAGIKNILLVGPAGSGKTKLAHDLALALNRPFASVGCTAGMPEWHLIGRSMPNLQTGGNTYHESQWVKLYETGGVFLLDEIDAADPNVLLVMNSGLSNGHLPVPARTENPVASRHADFIFIAAANTYGTAATRQYVGRNQLDASTLSRFSCATIDVDYDRDLEKAIVPEDEIRNKVWSIREKIEFTGIRRIVGTRELINVAALVRSGETLPWAIQALATGWTDDEKSKVGIPVR